MMRRCLFRRSTWSFLNSASGASPPKQHRHYTYKPSTHEWPSIYPVANGKRQSPINLALNDPDITVPAAPYTPELTLDKYSSSDITSVENTGITVMFHAHENATVITGGPIDASLGYRLLQFHFHWGSHSHCGSEHLLNGRQFSAELHLVHFNTKYSGLDEAVEHEDGLVVVAAFLDAKESHPDNPAFTTVVENLQKVVEFGSSHAIEEPSIDCNCLLPRSQHHYATYKGSLTAPPLKECVRWVVLLEPVSISERQMCEFRRLEDEHGEKLENNYRHLQSMFGRKIMHCGCCI